MRDPSAPSPLTSARGMVAGPLSRAFPGHQVPVHEYAPDAIAGPCVVLFPGSPWIAPKGAVTLEVVLYAGLAGGLEPAIRTLEDMIYTAREALWDAAIAPGDVDPPRIDTTAQTLSVSLPVTLRVSCH